MSSRTHNRPNRALLDDAIGIFLHEMVPCVIQDVEAAGGNQPMERAAIAVFGPKPGEGFVQDMKNYDVNKTATTKALIRIAVAVEFMWPVFKKRLGNRKIASSALKQIEYASIDTVSERDRDPEPLYVEQRLDDMSTVLGRIGAHEARAKIEDMKKSIR